MIIAKIIPCQNNAVVYSTCCTWRNFCSITCSRIFLKLLITFLYMFGVTFLIRLRIANTRSSWVLGFGVFTLCHSRIPIKKVQWTSIGVMWWPQSILIEIKSWPNVFCNHPKTCPDIYGVAQSCWKYISAVLTQYQCRVGMNLFWLTFF
jgi:hypothetical protein